MRIGALTVTKRPERIIPTAQMMAAQAKQPDAWLVFTHGWQVTEEQDKQIREMGLKPFFIEQPQGKPLGDMRNEGFDLIMEASFEQYDRKGHRLVIDSLDVIATFDDDDYYAPSYFSSLAEEMDQFPEGGVYGMREYHIGWVPYREGLKFDGSNIYGKWMSDGGKRIKANHVNWCVDATIAVRAEVWRQQLVRFGPGERLPDRWIGECERFQQMAQKNDVTVIARDPAPFCVARWDHPDAAGGTHEHTWKGLKPQHLQQAVESTETASEPEPDPTPASGWANVVRGVLVDAQGLLNELLPASAPQQGQADGPPKGRLWIYVRRRKAGEIMVPQYMHGLLQEDENLEPGMLQFRLDHHPIHTIMLGKGEP